MFHDNIPKEVAEAMCIRMSRFVGKARMDRYQDIVARYPEWFPWETKYRSVPQEVHDAYWKEKYPPLDFSKPRKGLWEQINKKPQKIKKGEAQSIVEMLEELFKIEKKQRKKEIARKKKDKKLWDKYYKPYKLEYRG